MLNEEKGTELNGSRLHSIHRAVVQPNSQGREASPKSTAYLPTFAVNFDSKLTFMMMMMINTRWQHTHSHYSTQVSRSHYSPAIMHQSEEDHHHRILSWTSTVVFISHMSIFIFSITYSKAGRPLISLTYQTTPEGWSAETVVLTRRLRSQDIQKSEQRGAWSRKWSRVVRRGFAHSVRMTRYFGSVWIWTSGSASLHLGRCTKRVINQLISFFRLVSYIHFPYVFFPHDPEFDSRRRVSYSGN